MRKLITLLLAVTTLSSVLSAQTSPGDMAFIAFNVDGNDDLALVTFVDIPASSIYYLTDNEPNGSGGFTSGEGLLSWTTGGAQINAGSVVVFSNLSSTGRSSNFGSLASISGSFNLGASGDAAFLYTSANAGTNSTSFVAGIQNASGQEGTLAGTGLTAGSTFLTKTSGASDDGGEYVGPRTGESSFTAYFSLIADNLNWSFNTSDGTALLPFDATVFTISGPGCTASIAFNSATCDNVTSGTDTYTSTFDVLIGSEGTLNVTSDFGTPSPSTISADGTITVTGVDEGQAVTVTVSGAACNIQATSTPADCVPIPPSVQFQTTSSTIGEGDTSIDICVEIANPDPIAASSVDLVFDNIFSSATIVDDFGTSLVFGPSTGAIEFFYDFATTLTWAIGETDPICLTITLVDDIDIEGDETAEFFLDNSNSGINLDANGFHSLTITDNDGPQPCPTSPVWEVVTTDNSPAASDGNNGEWTVDGTGFTANGFCGGCTDLVDTWLIYGPLDASAATALNLTFDATEAFGITDLNVQYSTDYASDPCPSNATWASAAVITDGGTQNVDLLGAAGSTGVFIGIQYNDDGVDGYSDWILDNFVLVSDACPTVGTPVVSTCVVCTTTLAAVDAVCDDNTLGTDTYTATFSFDATTELNNLTVTVTGGTSATTTVTAGTSGTIEVLGTEGTDATVELTNGLCTLSATQSSPICVPIPVPSCGAGETSLVFDSFEGGTSASTVSPPSYDTGGDIWGPTSSLNNITAAQAGVEFWGMSDLENGNGGVTTGERSSLFYSPTYLAGDYTFINVSFYYYTIGFDGPDAIGYDYSFDGGTVTSIELDKNTDSSTGWTEVTLVLPVDPSSTGFELELWAIQNGSDWAGFDEVNICGSTVVLCTATLSVDDVSCDGNTAGVDTYTAVLSFDATSETEDLTITVDPAPTSQSAATITAGASGTFTVTMPETTTSYTVTLSNSACDIEQTVTGVTCDPLPQLVINEVDYDQPEANDPAEFIELYNAGPVGLDLSDFEVKLWNGSSSTVYSTFALAAVTLAPGDYYVLGNASVPNVDEVVFADNAFQNGAPDGVELLYLGTQIDAMTYEGTISGITETASAPTDNGGVTGSGLSRIPDGQDTNDNSVDFVFTCITPGVANVICAANEDCVDAIAITPSIFGIIAWQTFALGGTQSLSGCEGDADDDIWFSFTANSSNDMVIAQDPTGGYDAVIEVYEGCGGASLGCYNAYGSGAIERALPGGLTPGQEYYFRVYDAASGPSASTNVRVMVKTYEDSQLRAPSCGATGLLLNQVIYSENDGSGQLYSNPAVGVNGYAFRFQEQGGGLDVTVQRPVSNGWYFQLVNAGLEYGKSYDVTVSHRVIVQANGFVGQYWSQFGTVCSISMAASIPTTQLRAQYCTGDDYFLSDQLFADVVTGASNYRFTFVPSGPFNTLQEVSANYAVSLQNVGSTGNRLLYGVSYTVTVEALVNGTWSAPGSSCVIFMSSQPEDTSVRASYCGDDYAYPSSNFILAESVVGATAYEFQFSPQPSGMALTKLVPTVSFTFGLSSLPFVVGTTYNVQVRAFSGVTAGDFVDTGCEITILAPPMMAQESMTSEEEIKASALTHTLDYSLFPNPNDGTEFMVQRMDGSFSEGAIGIEILDITGKVLHTEMKAVKGDSRLLVDPASDLRKGLYLLRVTDEKGSQTLRFTVD